MKRRVLRFGAIIGAATVSTLAVAPAFAAATVSQASAQSLEVSIAGNAAVSQKLTATNDGSSKRVDESTVPNLATVLGNNNAVAAGVAPQTAVANSDGTSYACAGIAGTGGGIATIGNSACNIQGKPLTLNLGTLNLDLVHLLGPGAVSGPLGDALKPVTDQLGDALNNVISQLTSSLATTPLGQISLTGGLSAVEATCTANPDAAKGDAQIVDTAGRHTIPISVTIPGGQTIALADVNVNLPGKPGGTDVLVSLDQVTQAVIDAVTTELNVALNGALKPLSDAVKGILQPIQDSIVKQLVTALKPALQALSDNLLKITVNDVTPGDGGRSVEVKTLDLQVLPAAKQFTGSSLISGVIGHVKCGPNTRVTTPATPTATVKPPKTSLPDVPTVVDSGLAGHEDHTARNVLGATGALLLIAGTAGLLGYRRMLGK